jgi:hypothetical protein
MVALALLPPPPDANSTSAAIRQYLEGHAGAIRVACVLSALGALALLPFFACLRRRLDSTAGDTLFSAGTVTVVAGVMGSILQAGLVNAQHRLGAGSLLSYFAIERMVFYVAPAVAVAAVGAAAAVAYRGRLPGWLMALSGLLAAVATVGGVANLASDGRAAGGIGLPGFLLTIVWVAASAVVLLRAPAPVSASDVVPSFGTT